MLRKRKDGWDARNLYDAAGNPCEYPVAGARMLEIHTYKINGTLVSCAAVNLYSNGGYEHAYGPAEYGGDYSKYVIAVRGGRATEKNVAAQHAKACAMVPEILKEVEAHYAKAMKEAA